MIFSMALAIIIGMSVAAPSFAATTHKLEDLALFLDTTTEVLIEEINSGMTWSEIAQTHGVEANDLRNYMNQGSNSAFSKLMKNEEFANGLAELLGISTDLLRLLISQGFGLEGLSEEFDVEIVILKGYVKEAIAASGLTSDSTTIHKIPSVAQYLQ